MSLESEWRRRLEAQVLELDRRDQDALDTNGKQTEHFIQMLRESRAAWLLLLPAPPKDARALFIGDGRSGTPAGMARLGYAVTIFDGETRGFAAERGAATGADLAPDSERGGDGDFGLVLIEDDIKQVPISLEKAVRLTKPGTGILALTSDNSLAYKRSSGARADFSITTPFAFAKALVLQRRGHLAHQKAALEGLTGSTTEAASLYPDRRDFAHVIALDADAPRITIGPMERANRPKLIGHKMGLFRHLTPSFALWSKRTPDTLRHIDLIFAQLQGRLRTKTKHTPEHVIATRGNSALIQTDAGWVLRIPLGHRAVAAAKQNAVNLRHMAEHYPDFPVPTSLFAGDLELTNAPTLLVSCEVRLEGFGAGQLAGNPAAFERLTTQLGAQLATLKSGPKHTLTPKTAGDLFHEPFNTVRERCADQNTAAALDRLKDEVLKAATGLSIPTVACHRDLRPKHVVCTAEGPHAGQLKGVVDWAALQAYGPPLYDLFHFIAQARTERCGAARQTPAQVWNALQERQNLEPFERETVEAYEAALDLPQAWYGVIARAYPILFGAMAEENWDFSRPLWLRRMFGIGATC